MTTYTLHHNDGSNSRYGITLEAALRQIAEKHEVNIEDMVTHEDEGERPRTLVWTSEASAENDDGAKAVAELIKE